MHSPKRRSVLINLIFTSLMILNIYFKHEAVDFFVTVLIATLNVTKCSVYISAVLSEAASQCEPLPLAQSNRNGIAKTPALSDCRLPTFLHSDTVHQTAARMKRHRVSWDPAIPNDKNSGVYLELKQLLSDEGCLQIL